MISWWSSLDSFEKFFFYFAIPFSITFIINLIITLLGFNEDFVEIEGNEIFDIEEGGFLDGDLQLLTIRNLFIFFMIFGWAGLAFYNYGFSRLTTTIFAILAGLIAVLIEASVFYLFGKLTSSGNMDLKYAVGETGRVYVPIPGGKSGIGKIQITFQGVFREVEAMTESDRLSTGSTVRVVGVYNNLLLVKEEE